jgi:hypothetical protein
MTEFEKNVWAATCGNCSELMMCDGPDNPAPGGICESDSDFDDGPDEADEADYE